MMSTTVAYPQDIFISEREFQIYEQFRNTKSKGLGTLYKVRWLDSER